MTRGREANVLHIVADNLHHARAQFVDALQLDRADRGLQAATTDAQIAVAGLVAEGPVKVVNDERARLVEAIAHADREVARWEHARRAAGHSSSRPTPTRKHPAGTPWRWPKPTPTAVLEAAMRPLLAQATVDGQAYLDAADPPRRRL